MKTRREFLSPGVTIGLVATLLAYDLRCAGAATSDHVVQFWLIGFLAPYLGCLWVGLKHRSEGRGVGRSLWVTLTMGALAGTTVMPVLGTVYGVIYTAMFILPPTLWVALISIEGFHRAREGSIARTIWWRRRWHATVAICAGAIATRLFLAPATPYAVGLSIGIAVAAVLCLLSLISMSRELTALTADLAPMSEPRTDEPTLDLGVGDTMYALVEPATAAPYRSSATVEARATGDLVKVRAMMRHTLWGAVALAAFATTTLAVAGISLHLGR